MQLAVDDQEKRTRKNDVADAALEGLCRSPKTLPSWMYYDKHGCCLFYEKMIHLPEYYITRTESALLGALGSSVLPDNMNGANLIEFGGSDETKARHLLDLPGAPFQTYVTIDVAEEALGEMCVRLTASHPTLKVIPIVGDFLKPVELPPLNGPRIGFITGSTIGNLHPEGAVRFLTNARSLLSQNAQNAWFLLGADLRKSPDLMLHAYNDAEGINAAFNLNLLTRLNREAGANFDLSTFRHEALWNDAVSRTEMHLFSLQDQTVMVDGIPICFRDGESILTGYSRKFTSSAMQALAAEAGWRVYREWSDPCGLYGIFLLCADHTVAQEIISKGLQSKSLQDATFL